jgi:hypothetical protein
MEQNEFIAANMLCLADCIVENVVIQCGGLRNKATGRNIPNGNAPQE